MAIINVGSGDLGGGGGPTVNNYMYVGTDVPANGTGFITRVDFSFDSINAGTLELAVGSVSGTTVTQRSWVNISSGSLTDQVVVYTSAGLDFSQFAVSQNDLGNFLSVDCESTRYTAGTLGYFTSSTMVTTSFEYTGYTGLAIEMSMTGTTGDDNTIDGIDWGDIATVDGIDVADIDTINGITMIGGEIVPRIQLAPLGIINLGFISKQRFKPAKQREFEIAMAKFRKRQNTSIFDLKAA